MKKILSLLALSCFGMGAWAQTVIAHMQDFVSNGTNNGVTEATIWKASEDKVYSFSDNHYFSGIANDDVVAALEGDKYVTVAMYVYGSTLTGCPFGYGDGQDGLKYAFRNNSAAVEVTTKGVADFGATTLGSMQASGWNLVAFTVPGKTCTGTDSRYLSPAGHYTKAGKNLSNMKQPTNKLFAIGSGDQGTTRECFTGMLANVTVMTSDDLLQIQDIQAKMGEAPTLNTVEGAFPAAGTYYAYIENRETSRMPFLYNSIQYSDNITIQANAIGEANGFVWKVVSDGNGKVTVKNAENGKGIKATGKCTGIMDEFQYTPGVTSGYYNLINNTLINGDSHDRLNCANSNDYKNEAGLRAVTTWTGAHTDNDWRFDVIDTEGLSEYNVVVTGAELGYVTYKSKKAANGGFFLAASVAKSELTAADVLGFESEITVAGNTITVTYTQTATPVDVDYNIYVDDTKVATVTRSEFEGMAPSFTFTHPAYVTVTQEVPATITAGVTSYDIKTSYNEALPFKLDGTKYNIKENRPNPLWIFYDGSALKTIAGQVPTYDNQDNYKWTFGGDWYNGFTLKNVAENKYVTFESVNPNNKDAVLTETLGAGAYFDLVQSGTFNYLKIHGTTVDAYISNRGGAAKQELTHWNSSSNIGDTGAQLLITEAEEIAAPTFTFTPEEGKYYSLKVKNTELYVNINTTTAESEAKQVVLGTEPEGFRFTATTGGYHVQNVSDKYIGGHTNTWNMNASTPEVWTIEIAEDGIMLLCAQGHMGLDEVVAGKAFYRNKGGVIFIVEEYVAPAVSTDKFYMLKSKAYGQDKTDMNNVHHTCGYMDAVTVTIGNNPTRTFDFNGYGSDDVTFSKVFQFRDADGDGNFNLFAEGGYMQKLQDGSINAVPTATDATAADFTITEAANEGYYYLIDANAPATANYRYAQLSDWWGFGIGGWNPGNAGSSDDERCQWAFVEVETVTLHLTTIGTASYATLYAPYAVELPAGVKAYTATFSDDNAYLTAAEIEGTLVPAGSAVILVSESAATSAELTLSNSDAAALTSDLQGTYRAETAGTDKLVLSNNEGKAGFYKYTGTQLGANKVYVTLPAGSNALTLRFDTLTGINSAEAQATAQSIFDLQGRRVMKAQNGLFIQNGKKVIK